MAMGMGMAMAWDASMTLAMTMMIGVSDISQKQNTVTADDHRI